MSHRSNNIFLLYPCGKKCKKLYYIFEIIQVIHFRTGANTYAFLDQGQQFFLPNQFHADIFLMVQSLKLRLNIICCLDK
jgi:hypothetical protein